MDQNPPEQALVILAQYIKDFSFENPSAPHIYQALSQSGPEIKFDIDIVPAALDPRIFEIVLVLRVSATIGENTAFLAELDYAGVVRIGATVPEDAIESLLFSETPRHLYPFARSILAKITGDAAFPPLFVNPIDFENFYRGNKIGALAAVMGNPEQTGDAPATAAPAAESPDAATASEAS